jgi:hypothetical protein
MTIDLSKLTVCCVDNGLFSAYAEKLAQSFGRTLYFVPWVSSFPTRHIPSIGQGLPGVERILNLDEYEDQIDCFVFLDVHFGPLQKRLAQAGRKVFGSMGGDEMELFRWDSKELLRKLGLPVGQSKLIKGMDALEALLKTTDDLYIKVSEFRGIGETWHHKNYDLSKSRLLRLRTDLGPLAKIQEFIVEWPIETAGEVGWDQYTVHGQYPKTACFGFEQKDVAYCGAIVPYADLPKEVQEVNRKMSPAFKSYGYQGFYSSEIRIGKDGKSYLIDHTARTPEPPGMVYLEWFKNLANIIWSAANGELLEPEPTAKYAAELILYAENAAADWFCVQYPDKVAPFVKLYNEYRDGQHWIVPTDAKLVQIGGVLGFGDTIKEAFDQAIDHADQVQGDGLEVKKDSIPKLLETIRDSAKQGIGFGDSPIPEKI